MTTEPRCSFYVGQRVTPRREVNNKRAIEIGMRTGGVYTIRSIQIQNARCNGVRGEYVTLLFRELKDRPNGIGWLWSNFRPITDISTLEALLNTTKFLNRTLESTT